MQERQPSNSLQLHWYSSWFNFCLELHTLSSSLHFHFHDSCWARNLVLFTLKLNLILLSSYFLFYLEQSKWIIKSTTTLTMFINANINRTKKVLLEFLLASIGLAMHGWFFRDTHFVDPSKLKANDSPTFFIVQTLNNLINVFLIHPGVFLYRVFSSNIYEYLKYHKHQYYPNGLKNDRYMFYPVFLHIISW